MSKMERDKMSQEGQGGGARAWEQLSLIRSPAFRVRADPGAALLLAV